MSEGWRERENERGMVERGMERGSDGERQKERVV